MTKDDRARLAPALFAMAAAFRTEMSDPLLAAYEIAIEDVPVDAVIAACKRAIKRSGDAGGKFMPSPGELRGMAHRPRTPLPAWMMETEQERERRHRAWLEAPDWKQLPAMQKPKHGGETK